MDRDCHNGFGVRLRNVTELLLSIHIFDNFAFTSIYKYMHEKLPFLCMSAFVGVHQYNFDSWRQDERTK